MRFSDYWARDTFWAMHGMLEIGDVTHTKLSLEFFLRHQHKSGKIARKIKVDFNRLKYFFRIKYKRKKPRAVFDSPFSSRFSFDDNLLCVIAFCKYVEKTEDLDFAKKYYGQISSALAFYPRSGLVKNHLLDEVGLAGWMDTVLKRGHVLYTNCLWFEAVTSLHKLSGTLKKPFPKALSETSKIKSQIQKKLWLEKEKYFADSANENSVQTYFDLAGNALALLFGIATDKQAKSITAKIDSLRDPSSGLHPVNDPLYPWWKINPFAVLFGIFHYHNGISWSWTEAIMIAAKAKKGFVASSKKDLESFSKLIQKHGHVHETYYLSGKPFGHFFWKSAVPFSWGAGLFLYADAQLERVKK